MTQVVQEIRYERESETYICQCSFCVGSHADLVANDQTIVGVMALKLLC